MTGTAQEAAGEFWQIYNLPVVVIPTNRPCIRTVLPDIVLSSKEAKWPQLVEEIRKVHNSGRPILVGTRSVHDSEHLSTLLTAQGLDHQVLNAVRHREEAQIVAEAGQPGKITVATNMAGRGTDIKLGRGVAQLGGLHVIAAERNESGRIDRQLFGRCARQGDPGSA
jgi:preprotein translocase subunit SecA